MSLSGSTLAEFDRITVEPSKYLTGWFMVIGYRGGVTRMVIGTYRNLSHARSKRTQLLERRRSYLRSLERGLF